jgi:hypothetical protein
VRQREEDIDAVEADAVHLGRRRHVEHRFQIDMRFGVRPSLADQTRPHRVVQFRICVLIFSAHMIAPQKTVFSFQFSVFSFQFSVFGGTPKGLNVYSLKFDWHLKLRRSDIYIEVDEMSRQRICRFYGADRLITRDYKYHVPSALEKISQP